MTKKPNKPVFTQAEALEKLKDILIRTEFYSGE